MNRKAALELIVVLFVSASAESASVLQPRAGGRLLYDPISHVTWLADANYAWSSEYARQPGLDPSAVRANGEMSWHAAQEWAGQLDIEGATDWRLPSVAIDHDCYNVPGDDPSRLARCTSGAFTTLWTEVLGGGWSDRPGELDNQEDLRLFDNWTTGQYWTASANDRDPSGDSANYFSPFGGYSQTRVTSREFAIAVHDGDVGGVIPPEPPRVLEPRQDGKFLYDPVGDVTWLADANNAWSTTYSRTPGTDPAEVSTDGRMSWQAAQDWAAQLDTGGASDWRLPSAEIDFSCYNIPGAPGKLANCTRGELTTLWTEVLGGEWSDRPGQLANQGDVRLFDHWQAGQYWTSSLNPRDLSGMSGHYFSPFGGYGQDALTDRWFAIAVRDGDVGERANVPEPSSWLLLGVGLLAIRKTSTRC